MSSPPGGTLAPSILYPSSYAEAMRVGDLNADGRLDAIGLELSMDGHTNIEEAGIWYQNPAGSFDPQCSSHCRTDSATMRSSPISTTMAARTSWPRRFRGTDKFTYTISDGKGGTASALVTVTVPVVRDLAR